MCNDQCRAAQASFASPDRGQSANVLPSTQEGEVDGEDIPVRPG